jgi:hypothetical protein
VPLPNEPGKEEKPSLDRGVDKSATDRMFASSAKPVGARPVSSNTAEVPCPGCKKPVRLRSGEFCPHCGFIS